MPKISIIVPVYNVESHLRQCIDSIVSQTFRHFELIIINDGSTDNCGDICNEYANYDMRIKVVHKEYGGPSSARNAGIEVARGDYLGFVDGDDWIEPNMYEQLLYNAEKESADIVFCRIQRHEGDKIFYTRDDFTDENKVMTGDQLLEYFLLDKIDCSLCTKLFKRCLFDNIRLPNGRINEDFAVLYKMIAKANKCVYVRDVAYNYIRREHSLTTSPFNVSQFDKFYNALDMYKYIGSNKRTHIQMAEYYYLYQSFCLLKHLLLQGLVKDYNREYNLLKAVLLNHSINIITNPHIEYRTKFSYLYIAYFPHLYKVMHK